MSVNYLLYIVLGCISGSKLVCGLDFGYNAPDYCSYKWPCYNKSHVLCNFTRIPKGADDRAYKAVILNKINEFRENIRDSNKVCNLHNLEWNQMLESLAEGAAVQTNFNDYCLSNDVYKDILNFTLTSIDTISDLSSQMYNFINSHDKQTWLYSAYSNKIGCAINDHRKFVVCMINGVELISTVQSFGYMDECDAPISKLGTEPCLNTAEDVLNCDNQLICNPGQNFTSATLKNIPFTTKKFILHKLMHQDRNITWDGNLEYLAVKLVTQKLTKNDKCLTIKLYSNLTAHIFEGSDRYTDDLSNIDNLWYPNNISQNVGCAMYNRLAEDTRFPQDNTYIYCLTNYIEFHESVESSEGISLMYLYVPLLIVLCSVVIILVTIRIKIDSDNAKKRQTVVQDPSDYYDMIDVR